jgi:hypothetical protein
MAYVTGTIFPRAKEEVDSLKAENQLLKEQLAEMRSVVKRKELVCPTSVLDGPKRKILGKKLLVGTYRTLTTCIVPPTLNVGYPVLVSYW